MTPSPYEIIIICSVGGILVGCFFIWTCDKYCCNRPFFSNKRGVVGEPLLNLLEAGEAGDVGIGVSDSSCSFSSGSSSSGSETTSIYMTKPLKNFI